jgi:hypothetical protein
MTTIAADRRDRFTISYSIVVGTLLLLFAYSSELDRVFNLYLLIVPLLLVPAIAVSIWWSICLIGNAIKRRWRRVASIVAAPVVAYFFFVALGALGINPDRIRFELNREYYQEQVALLPQTSEPRFKIFDWGSTGGAAVVNIFHTLIYDESDEIGLSPERRSIDWNRRANALCPGSQMCSILHPDPPRHFVNIRSMGAHFYLVTQTYQ